MKALATSIICCMLALATTAQHKTFGRQEDRLKVYEGDTVSILADSAYIVSAVQALQLNEKLLALRHAQQVNQQLHHSHAEMLAKVSEIEDEVTRLLGRLRADEQVLTQSMSLLLTELDESIAILQHSNLQLTQTNEQLAAQLTQLDQTVRLLRQENRRLAWRHTRHKVVIGIAAFVLGLVVGG